MIRIEVRTPNHSFVVREFHQTAVRIGRRAGNDIVLEDESISGNHGEIRIYPEGLLFEDLKSMNGSHVRRRSKLLPVTGNSRQRLLLEDEDELLLGEPTHPFVLVATYVPEEEEPTLDDSESDVELAETLDASTPSALSELSKGFDRAALLALNRFTEQTLTARGLDVLLESFANNVLGMFSKADRISVYLRSKSDEYRPVLARDRNGECPYEPVSRTLKRVVLERGQAVLFATSDRELNDASSLRKSRVSIGLCAPLRAGGRTFGFAQVDSRGTLVPFNQVDLQVFAVFSRQLALLLENAQLHRGMRATVRDLELARAEMEKLAFEDSVTGLANRRLFRDRLEQVVRMGQRSGHQSAVLYLDLDDFKRVNDSLGHDAGDELLCIIANRLRSCVRSGDTVARVGGDEFALLLSQVSGSDGALLVAEKVLATLREPIRLRAQHIIMTTSLGITLTPDDAPDAETLLKNADLALYRAKKRGHNNAEFFVEEMMQDAAFGLLIESELRRAVERAEFVLHFQPVLRLDDGTQVAAEALLRWQHPERGLLLPESFIQTAEESALILPISEWVLRTACEQLARIQRVGRVPLQLSVNLSARQFSLGDLAESFERILRETAVDASAIQVELTETLLMENLPECRRILNYLRSLGICVAIDDFGTGYSSLSYLKELPIDTLKIDRRFIHGIEETTRDAALPTAMIAMAHKLNLAVVAEGIETHAQLAFLRLHGCDLGQGYLLGRPQVFNPAWEEDVPEVRLSELGIPPADE